MFSISEAEAAEEERGVNTIAAAPDEVSSFSLKKPTYQKCDKKLQYFIQDLQNIVPAGKIY